MVSPDVPPRGDKVPRIIYAPAARCLVLEVEDIRHADFAVVTHGASISGMIAEEIGVAFDSELTLRVKRAGIGTAARRWNSAGMIHVECVDYFVGPALGTVELNWRLILRRIVRCKNYQYPLAVAVVHIPPVVPEPQQPLGYWSTATTHSHGVLRRCRFSQGSTLSSSVLREGHYLLLGPDSGETTGFRGTN